MQVLIIEDEQLLLKAASDKFKLNKIETVEFGSAVTALDYLKKLKKGYPDVMWLDYYLPDMSGMEFMEKIADIPVLKKIPVIVVSNSASEEHVAKMLELGATKYLLKADYRLDDLVKIFKEVVENDKK